MSSNIIVYKKILYCIALYCIVFLLFVFFISYFFLVIFTFSLFILCCCSFSSSCSCFLCSSSCSSFCYCCCSLFGLSFLTAIVVLLLFFVFFVDLQSNERFFLFGVLKRNSFQNAKTPAAQSLCAKMYLGRNCCGGLQTCLERRWC